MTERSAKVISVSGHGDLNLEGNARPGFPIPSRQLSLAFVMIPRLNSKTGDESGAFQAREFLRKLLVGKQVTFTIAYTIPNSQREFGIVRFNGKDVNELLLREGLIKFREESNKRENVDNTLLEMYQIQETQARSEGKGLWAHNLVSIDAGYDTPADLKNFLSTYQNKSILAVVEQVRAGDIIRARLLLEPTKHQHLNLLIAGIKCPATNKTNPDGTVAQGEEFGETAKSFVETRLLQRTVQVTLLGANQNASGLVASISHPAGNIAETLLSNGLARVVDYQSTLVGDSIGKLRAAEAAAKTKKFNLWHSFVSKKTTAAGSFDAVVSRIFSADTLFVRTKDGSERRVQLSSIRGPRANDEKQAQFVPESKEFLRKKSIGKHVTVTIDFIKPASEGFEKREAATIVLGKDNLAKLMIEKGYATVVRHRKDDEDRSPIWDELLAAEEAAISAAKGMHSPKGPIAQGRIVEASETLQRAKQYLSTFQRAKRVAGVVEFVSSGGRFKIFVPREYCKLTLVLSGIRVPRTARNASEASEPWGQEAADFATRKVLQRDVELDIETTDRIGGFVGVLFLNNENFAVALLEEGLATVHDYSAEQSGFALLYREAQGRAQLARKGLHNDYNPDAPEGNEKPANGSRQVEAALPSQREYLDVVITDINPKGTLFNYQIAGDGAKQLERLMTDLQVFYKSSSAAVSAPPKVGDTVAARFSEDNLWYRAKVKRVDRFNSKAEVMYYDYGNSELVPFKSLAPLDSKFTALPAQSKEAKLSFLELPQDNEEYLEDAVNYLSSLCQKQLVASVDRRDGNTAYMSLYNPDSQDPNETLNASLVQEGWATVLPAKKVTWEKAYDATLKQLAGLQVSAQRRRLGMFEFGDTTAYED